MHVAASKPVAVSAEQVPRTSSAERRERAARGAGRSRQAANIVEKMVDGAGREVPVREYAAGPAVRQGRSASRRSVSS
jgi:translation elongation factor EF-Ts